MTFRTWAILFGTMSIFTFWSNIGEAVFVTSGDGVVMNQILGFSLDQVSQGGGFVGTIRVVIAFFTTTLPQWATFNYTFLQTDSLQIVRWFMVTIFGSIFVIMLSMSFIGILRRNY